MTLLPNEIYGSDMNYGRDIPRYKRIARCHSERCNRMIWRGTTASKEIPEAKRDAIDCPRCGHSLEWTMERLK